MTKMAAPSITSQVTEAVLRETLRDEAGCGKVGRHADGLEDGPSALPADVRRVVRDLARPVLN